MILGTRTTRGTYAVIFGITAAMLLGFTSIAVDAGWHRVGANQLYNAADAGAHAGSLLLDGSPEHVELAKARAKAIAEANLIHGKNVIIRSPDTDIVVGRFDVLNENDCILADGCWTVIDQAYAGYDPARPGQVTPADANAVRVNIEDAVTTAFSELPFGKTSLAVASTATARLPITSGVGCAFPLTLPQCSADNWMDGEACDKLVRMRLSSSQIDTVSWSTPVGGSTYDTLEAIADINGDSCTSSWSEADIADGEADVQLKNGQMNTAFQILEAQLDSATYMADVDGDGIDEVLSYENARIGWDYDLWGPDCPGTLTTALCDASLQGTCDCGDASLTCINSGSAADCATNGGSWVTTCPDIAADCANGVFLRRQLAVFSSPNVSCDANGNVQTQSSWNYNDDQDITGFVTVLIYNIESQGGDKYIDAYLSCRNSEGDDAPDTDGDGQPNAVHDGSDQVIENADKGNVAIVR